MLLNISQAAKVTISNSRFPASILNSRPCLTGLLDLGGNTRPNNRKGQDTHDSLLNCSFPDNHGVKATGRQAFFEHDGVQFFEA